MWASARKGLVSACKQSASTCEEWASIGRLGKHWQVGQAHIRWVGHVLARWAYTRKIGKNLQGGRKFTRWIRHAEDWSQQSLGCSRAGRWEF